MVWGAAIVGVVLNAIDVQKYSRISMVCYVAMGWVVVLAIRSLWKSRKKGGHCSGDCSRCGGCHGK